MCPTGSARPGSSVDQARFVPVGADALPAAMDVWEAYLHAGAPDILVQLAILHAEFEAIHPFLDGNGRLGRLLVPLFLHGRGLLARPNFYMSGYLEANRDEYYDRLLAVSRDDDWTGWCAFFLRAVIAQAEANRSKASAIVELYRERTQWITQATGSRVAVLALEWMFGHPAFTGADFSRATAIPKATAARLLKISTEQGFLQEVRSGGGRRSTIYRVHELLAIAEAP